MRNNCCYVVGVSGGVDSVALLHMLVHGAPELRTALSADCRLVVAHVNHGIREQSSDNDQELVRGMAADYGLEFYTTNLKLGPGASEESARDARYVFFEEVAGKVGAKGVVLAHHKGDIIETAVINILRGTGRRGIVSLRSDERRLRPLLHMTKSQIIEYATIHGLTWHEDETNDDDRYLRNKIRRTMSRNEEVTLDEAHTHIANLARKSDLLDREIANLLQYKCKGVAIIARSWFVHLSHDIACELVYVLLTKVGVRDIDREKVERVVVATKVGRQGSRIDIDKDTIGMITKRSLRIVNRQTLKARRI